MNKRINEFLHWLTWKKNVGVYVKRTKFAFGLLAHTYQCGQVWLFVIRVGRRRFGYRTHGDATPRLATYWDAGWYFPWKPRYGSGRMA